MRVSIRRFPALVVLAAAALGVPVIGGIVPFVQSGYSRTQDRFMLNVLTVTYDHRSVGVKLEATERLPRANGEARVEMKSGITEIELELDEMKPAWSFGGDFNTFLLWAISPEGHADNLGEFILKGNRSKLNASTPMDTFGLIVTAEPHFLVDTPSPFVVLTNLAPARALPRAPEWVDLEIVQSHPPYRFERASLIGVPETSGEVRSSLRQAQVAVQLAERAGASRLAAAAFEAARNSLLMAEGAAETRSATHDDVERMARRAVRLASAAERQALEGRGADAR